MSKECCGENGCECHNGKSKEKIDVFGRFTILIMWIVILVNFFAIGLSYVRVQQNNRHAEEWERKLNQPVNLIFPVATNTVVLTNTVYVWDYIAPITEEEGYDPFLPDSSFRLKIVSEKQNFFLSKPISEFVTHTEILPDGTEVRVEME